MRCAVHRLDLPDDVCQHCGGSFCTHCMVYPNGTRKPGVCRTCGLALAGVRSARAAGISGREFRKRRTALLDERLKRPSTMVDATHDLSWLDEVEYGADAGGRGGRF